METSLAGQPVRYLPDRYSPRYQKINTLPPGVARYLFASYEVPGARLYRSSIAMKVGYFVSHFGEETPIKRRLSLRL
jgi:hypothetical protein